VTILHRAAQTLEDDALKKLIGVLAFALAISGKVEASTIIVDASGILVGAEDVNVNGTLYDVTFVEGTCASVFGACDLAHFTFTDSLQATLASQALLDQVFLDGPSGQFDSDLALTFGCGEASVQCSALTPYGDSPVLVIALAANRSPGYSDTTFTSILGTDHDTSTDGGSVGSVFVKWSLVSVPDGIGTIGLLGVSVLSMLALRRAI
jgi:hypothetical protein